jgi:hypothetical protein
MTKRLKYEDTNGRRRPQHIVRAMGNGTFGVVDVLTNTLVSSPQVTREGAWEFLREMEAKAA